MTYTPNKAASNARYLAKLAQLTIRDKPEHVEAIRAAAARAGQSVQGYILQAVRERMQRDKQETP